MLVFTVYDRPDQMIRFPGKQALIGALWRRYRPHARCLFVLSTGRTGTMALSKLLDLSADVHAIHEPVPHLRSQVAEAYAGIREHPQRFTQVFENARRSAIVRTHLKGKIYAETYYRMTFFAPVIADVLPHAKFLYVHRHPGDVVRSAMRRRFYVDNTSDPFRIEPLPDDRWYEAWPGWSPFEKCCWYWTAINGVALRFQRETGGERVMSVRFEDFVNPDGHTYRRVFDFANARCAAEDQAREVLSVRFNEQTVEEFPKYAEWKDAQKDTLRQIGGTAMDALGYA